METIEDIKTDEGYRAEPYICSEGKLTWLYGRNINDRPITKEEWGLLKDTLAWGGSLKKWAERLFDVEVDNLDNKLHNIGVVRATMPEEVYVIVLNMAYNMGITRFNPTKWPKFFKAIEDEEFRIAADEMVDSVWYGQVGGRSQRLVLAMSDNAF